MKKNLNQKKIYSIAVCIGLSMIILGLFLSYTTKYEEVPTEFKKIQYSIAPSGSCSCITFYDNNEFSEYDCDSEPTEMPFSGEFYDKYEYYSNGKIIFKGKGQIPIHAKILSWDSEKIVIKVLGKKQMKSCAINNKDTYEYYAKEAKFKGKELKKYLKKINIDNNLLLKSWDKEGNYICTKESDSECVNAKLITSEEFYSNLKDNKNYDVSYSRDEQGNIEYIMIM